MFTRMLLFQELSLFDQHLERINQRVPIPKAVSDALWEHIIRLAFSTFVEGSVDCVRRMLIIVTSLGRCFDAACWASSL